VRRRRPRAPRVAAAAAPRVATSAPRVATAAPQVAAAAPRVAAAKSNNSVVEPEARADAQLQAKGTPAERGNCCIMAFTDGTPGGFWLGTKHSTKGSSRGVVYEVEWYDEIDGTFELWDDGLDLMKGSKLLVEGVHLVVDDSSRRLTLTNDSIATIEAAIAERLEKVASGDLAVDDEADNVPCNL
jgi:hypothetical protein